MPSLSKNWLLTKLDITKKTKSIWSSMEFGEFSTKGVNELGLLEVLYMPLDGEFSVPTVYSTLKIFRGIEKVQEIRVPDPACGILAVNVAVGDQVIQDLAVAAGPNIYIYRKLKPYFKFKLPVFEPQEEELAVWQRAKTGTLSVNELWTSLDQLKQRAVRLTSRSARFLQLPLTDLSDYYDRYREVTLESQTVATCMQTLYRQQASSDSVQCLIVGAEQNCLFVVDPTTFVLLATVSFCYQKTVV
ncbi:hypothetical protein D915_001300 [Fasciola hepatica]|uniref:Bardet-Biedl syndrome 1 N-terminal domain-containing protein n=1 Tax=Fasciola hepatica TaxID=6192 RepID=A0A4E0RIL4_FASHE|nr:hypothetical protein D915_001300 [Fasciola hepatica]